MVDEKRACRDAPEDRLRRLRRRLINAALRSRLRWDQAEDVAQEVLSRAVAQGVHLEDHLEAWATVVCRNLCTDELRRSLRARALLEASSQATYASEERIEEVEDRLLAANLRARMARLPESQKAVMEAVAGGASVYQVAASNDTTIRAIESHLLRARRSLRRSS